MKLRVFLLIATVAQLLAQGDPAEQARREFLTDAVRFNQVNVRRMRGITPTPEEMKVVNAFNAKRGALNAEYKKTRKPLDSAGITPLNELGEDTYKGEQGGLYPAAGTRLLRRT